MNLSSKSAKPDDKQLDPCEIMKQLDAKHVYNSTEKDGIKQIFVLNANSVSQNQSIQESKAMTPCFLHTPNMTNKWNDFKPP